MDKVTCTFTMLRIQHKKHKLKFVLELLKTSILFCTSLKMDKVTCTFTMLRIQHKKQTEICPGAIKDWYPALMGLRSLLLLQC
jgi:hypothetical protein